MSITLSFGNKMLCASLLGYLFYFLLRYEHESGRKSSLELLALIFKNFPEVSNIHRIARTVCIVEGLRFFLLDTL